MSKVRKAQTRSPNPRSASHCTSEYLQFCHSSDGFATLQHIPVAIVLSLSLSLFLSLALSLSLSLSFSLPFSLALSLSLSLSLASCLSLHLNACRGRGQRLSQYVAVSLQVPFFLVCHMTRGERSVQSWRGIALADYPKFGWRAVPSHGMVVSTACSTSSLPPLLCTSPQLLSFPLPGPSFPRSFNNTHTQGGNTWSSRVHLQFLCCRTRLVRLIVFKKNSQLMYLMYKC